jgi:hypothetical protein
VKYCIYILEQKVVLVLTTLTVTIINDSDNRSPVTIDGKPVEKIKYSTTRNYFFTDRPEEDAVTL